MAPIFVSLARGALTDKLQKGDKVPPKGSHLEVGTQLKLPFASFPDFDELKNDEKFWSVRDVLENIAKNRVSQAKFIDLCPCCTEDLPSFINKINAYVLYNNVQQH